MLQDLVVDTNVWVDSGNPGSYRFADSVAFVTAMAAAQTILKVDPKFSWDSSTNRSRIVSEYMDKMSPGSTGFEILRKLAMSGRFLSIEALPSYQIKRQVMQLIRNKTDRVFLLVAIESTEATLVSHDYVDFQSAKRSTIKRKFGVKVVEADCCAGLL